MTPPGAPVRAPEPLARRYRPEHLDVLTPAERRCFLDTLPRELVQVARRDEGAWLQVARALGWELLYRIEPDLYERLIAGEHIHPGVIDWLPDTVDRGVEVGAGTGRFTVELAPRCRHLVAVEPAEPLRRLLEGKLTRRGYGHVEVRDGLFDALPVPDGAADLVVTCSALTPEESHGGHRGLDELERVCAPGGIVAIVWPPPEMAWLTERGYAYESFPGEMAVEFPSLEEAVALARIFYPDAVAEIERRRSPTVPYDVLGMNPPRDVCWKRMP